MFGYIVRIRLHRCLTKQRQLEANAPYPDRKIAILPCAMLHMQLQGRPVAWSARREYKRLRKLLDALARSPVLEEGEYSSGYASANAIRSAFIIACRRRTLVERRNRPPLRR